MKRGFSLALSILLGVSILSVISATNTKASSNLTPHGKEALRQIAECINRDDKDTLNVLYLIDESGSLDWNDADSVRSDALISSLRQFADASEQRPFFTINRAFTSFAEKFKVQKPWQILTTDSFDEDRKWITQVIPSLIMGKRTDWEGGLRGAQQEFLKKSKASSCEIMVWFTDGAINVSDSLLDDYASLERICGRNPANNQETRSGLINELRQANIWIQGILLRNDEAQARRYKNNQAVLQQERSQILFFQPIVEHSSNQLTYKCGTTAGAYGLVQEVTDPVDIIWPTQEFNCLSTNGRVVDVSSGRFTIDPGVSRFSVTAYAQGFELKGPNGGVIANQGGSKLGNVQVLPIDRQESVIQVSGEISNAPDSVTNPGSWRIKGQGLDKAIGCVYLDLEIQLSSSTCYAGEVCKFSGTVVSKGLAADLSVFNSLSIRSGEVAAGTVKELPEVSLNGGAFKSEFRTDPRAAAAVIGAELRLKTESGIEFSISTKRDINVIPPGIYPEIRPNPIKASDFDGPLNSQDKEAKAALTFIAPSRTAGQVCLSPLQVRSDVNPDRIESFRTLINGEEVSTEKCFPLEAGVDQDFELTIRNEVLAEGQSQGFIPVTYSAVDRPEIQSRVDVSFDSAIDRDSGKRLLWLVLLMLLGIGLPLGGLYLVNAANAKLLLKNLYLAQVPVQVTANGDVVSLKRSDSAPGNSLVSQDDFLPFISGPKKEKSIGVSAEKLEGKTPLNPFGLLRAIITTSPGMVVASNALGSTRGMANNQAPGSLNPSGLMYLVQSVSTNEKLQRENKGLLEVGEALEGRLVVLLSLDSDPYQQVERIRDDFQMNGGWLRQLLDERMQVMPRAEQAKKATTVRESKSPKVETDVREPSPKVSDGWDDDVSPQSRPTTDDWRSDSSSSDKTDDDW